MIRRVRRFPPSAGVPVRVVFGYRIESGAESVDLVAQGDAGVDGVIDVREHGRDHLLR
ncbi:hypothetical protein [Nocardia sp. NPDC052112]|uniref:hypothetical protein n=1 Tax=Nocardia sp. NPDC052112 TaxID=3155646 RepID=UPI00343BAE8F